jgi:hypothetical protein
MAANRHLSSSALLVVLGFFLAAVPGLYLFQAMVHEARRGEQRLVANLVVRLNDRTPHHLDLSLLPSEAPISSPGTIDLVGRGPLRSGSFPWREAPIEALLELDLARESIQAGVAPFDLITGGAGLTARYQERFLGSDEAPPQAVPCLGQLKVTKLVLEDEVFRNWSQVHTLQGLLELQCHGSGRDLTPSTEDDLHFTLLGTLDYRYGDPS